MLKDCVEGSTVKLEEFKEDLFYEMYHDGEFKPDTDWEILHDDWIRGLGFTQWWNEMLPSLGYVEYTGQDGRFLWVKDWATLVVIPGVHELPTFDIKATFNEGSLEDIEYAEGVVKDGIFYAGIIATERN
jgi:hypothetical protein